MPDYLIKETTLTRMADKVRVLSGETEQLTPEQMIDLLGIQRDYFLDCINFLVENGADVPENPTMAQMVEIMGTLQISSVGKIPKFTYVTSDGSSGGFSMFTENPEAPDDETVNYQIKFLKSGTLTFTQDPGQIDIFMVGGGGSGGSYGGGGGGYTETVTQLPLINTEYEIIIGEGGKDGVNAGAGGNTIAFGITVSGGQAGGSAGGSGGSGGGGGSGKGSDYGYQNVYSYNYGGDGGSDGYGGSSGHWNLSGNTSGIPSDKLDGSGYSGGSGQRSSGKGTTRAFGDSNGELFAGGGAGTPSAGTHTYNGQGGAGGGGSGAAGGNNTGGGGSGGYFDGGSGVVIIRNSRVSS